MNKTEKGVADPLQQLVSLRNTSAAAHHLVIRITRLVMHNVWLSKSPKLEEESSDTNGAFPAAPEDPILVLILSSPRLAAMHIHLQDGEHDWR